MFTKKVLKTILIIALATLIFGYIYYQSRYMILGPKIYVSSPTNHFSTQNPVVKVKGVVKRVSKLRVNNRDVLIDTDGNFYDTIILLDGYNIIFLEAWDRFGRKTEQKFELVLKSPPPSESISDENPNDDNPDDKERSEIQDEKQF